MARVKSSQKIVGFGTWVKTQLPAETEATWKRVGFLFHTRVEARNYLTKEFSLATAKVQAIRVKTDTRLPGQSWGDHKATTA